MVNYTTLPISAAAPNASCIDEDDSGQAFWNKTAIILDFTTIAVCIICGFALAAAIA